LAPSAFLLLPYLREFRGLRPFAQWVCENAELGQWSLGITRWDRALFSSSPDSTRSPCLRHGSPRCAPVAATRWRPSHQRF